MRFSYKGLFILGLLVVAGIFAMPKGVFALGFNVPSFHFDNQSNPSTLYITTTSEGNSFQAFNDPCVNSRGDDDFYVYEYQNSTVAYWYISKNQDTDGNSGSFNSNNAVDGLKGSTTPYANTPTGEDGCGYTDAVQWTYSISTPSANISSLNQGTYYFCLEVIAQGGSPTTFARCDAFTVNRPQNNPPGSFSLTSASVSNQSNYCQVNLNWSSSQYATSYTVQGHFWSTGSWFTVQSGIGGTSYGYQERKGVALYYQVIAYNSYGSYTSNTQYAGECPTASVSISSSPSSIAYGGSSTIYWTPSNAYACTASGGSSGWAGSRSSSSGQQSWGTGALYNPPASYTYSIYCSDADGGYASPTVSTTVSIGPPPTPSVSISASPTSLAWSNSGSTITWSSTNATSCTISPSGWTGTSDSRGTGALNISGSPYTYTATCTGVGGSNNNSAQVTVNPPTPTLSSVTTNANSINYCSAGPSGTTVSWNYSDPGSYSQAYYEVQVANNGNFSSPAYDSGKINSSSTTASLQSAGLQFNTTYQARVEVWDSVNGQSAWYDTNNWTTPPNAYPQVNFTWTPTSPQKGNSVPFTDSTVFSDSGSGHSWSWTFGDGGNSSSQNPSHTYNADNTYTVTLTATDNKSQTCSLSKAIDVQKPIPEIKEVAP